MKLELATQDDGTLLWTERAHFDPDRALSMTKDMGATWVRVNIYASYLARLGWGPWDSFVSRAAAHGLNVQMTITGQPKWDVANPDGGVPYMDPLPQRFASYAENVVSHFKGRVSRFSLWNEPNHPSFLASSHQNTADLYGKLYREAYEAIIGVDKTFTILFGELSSSKGVQAFLKRSVKGSHTFASGIAIHPYQYLTNPSKPASGDNYQWGNLPVLQKHLRELAAAKELRTRAGRALPVYVTEFGYFCEGEKRGIPEGRRLQYVRACIEQARAWKLRQFLYYHLIEAPDAAWNSGIIYRDGRPMPTYDEIKRKFSS